MHATGPRLTSFPSFPNNQVITRFDDVVYDFIRILLIAAVTERNIKPFIWKYSITWLKMKRKSHRRTPFFLLSSLYWPKDKGLILSCQRLIPFYLLLFIIDDFFFIELNTPSKQFSTSVKFKTDMHSNTAYIKKWSGEQIEKNP